MPFGRGRNWFGRGFWKHGTMAGMGPGWMGPGGMPFYRGYGGFRGRGRGNPYPFCRSFPWLPRGWWAVPQYAGWNPYLSGIPGPYGMAGYPAAGYRFPGYGGYDWAAGIAQNPGTA
jgi:hypothetical protein